MKWALENAGVAPAEVDYINAHGPGTVVGYPIETKAIRDRLASTPTGCPSVRPSR